MDFDEVGRRSATWPSGAVSTSFCRPRGCAVFLASSETAATLSGAGMSPGGASAGFATFAGLAGLRGGIFGGLGLGAPRPFCPYRPGRSRWRWRFGNQRPGPRGRHYEEVFFDMGADAKALALQVASSLRSPHQSSHTYAPSPKYTRVPTPRRRARRPRYARRLRPGRSMGSDFADPLLPPWSTSSTPSPPGTPGVLEKLPMAGPGVGRSRDHVARLHPRPRTLRQPRASSRSARRSRAFG